MNRSVLMAGIGVLAAAPVLSAQVLPVTGTHYATYTVASGELTPTPEPVACGAVCWSATYDTGWYFGTYAYDWVVLDWGDCGDPAEPYFINGFQFAYATEMVLPDRLDTIIWYYGEENGWNSYNRVPLAGYIVTDLPTGDPGGAWNAWTVTVDLEGGSEFEMSGSDLDADGLVDFGYTYWFQNVPAGDATGPHISGDPNGFADAPGQEDSFDAYLLDPCDPNLGLGPYQGTYWFSGVPYAQFYMEFYTPANGCPNPGDSGWFCTADIEYTNECVVDLLDLATLLGNYGMTTGATHEQGDVEPEDGNGVWDPTDGDGDVDLADLARLLTQYGDDCN